MKKTIMILLHCEISVDKCRILWEGEAPAEPKGSAGASPSRFYPNPQNKFHSVLLLIEIIFFIVGCSLGEHPLSKEPEPAKPTFSRDNLKSVQEGVSISLNKNDPNTSAYKTYRSIQRDNGYEEIKTTTEPSFIDKNVTEDTTYFYKIAGVSAGGLEGYDSEPAEILFKRPEIGYTITGTTLDVKTGKPIERVLVILEGAQKLRTTTDSSGKFNFTLSGGGEYTVTAEPFTSFEGRPINLRDTPYIKQTIVVKAAQGETHVEVFMSPIAQQIEKIQEPTNPFDSPKRVAFSRDGNKAYVTNELGGYVSVVNATNDTVVPPRILLEEHENCSCEPRGIAINPERPEVYVTCTECDGISVINTETRRETSYLSVGNGPIDLVTSHDGSTLYVVNTFDDSLWFIKTANREVSRKITVGDKPAAIALSPDGKTLYVANQNDDTVSVIDVIRADIQQTVSVGDEPVDITMAKDGRYVYVANYGGGLTVIDSQNYKFVKTFGTGYYISVAAVRYERDGREVAYVIDTDGQLSLLEMPAETLVKDAIRIGGYLEEIAFNPELDKFYVLDSVEMLIIVLGF